jgi:hypothetical protein
LTDKEISSMSDPLKDTPVTEPLYEGRLYEVIPQSGEAVWGFYAVACEGAEILGRLDLSPLDLAYLKRLVECRNLVDGHSDDVPDQLDRDLALVGAEINDELAERIVERMGLGFTTREEALVAVRELIETAWDRTEASNG